MLECRSSPKEQGRTTDDMAWLHATYLGTYVAWMARVGALDFVERFLALAAWKWSTRATVKLLPLSR